jgi:hypothetical protein
MYIDGSLLDYTLDEATDDLVNGSRTIVKAVEECWTFTRPAGLNSWMLSAAGMGKGIGTTVSEGANSSGEKLKEAGQAAEAPLALGPVGNCTDYHHHNHHDDPSQASTSSYHATSSLLALRLLNR